MSVRLLSKVWEIKFVIFLLFIVFLIKVFVIFKKVVFFIIVIIERSFKKILNYRI